MGQVKFRRGRSHAVIADPVAIAPGTDLIATSVWLSQNAYDIFSPFKILPVCRSV